MAAQADILSELWSRRDQLDPNKRAIVEELANRSLFGDKGPAPVAPVPGAAQMQKGASVGSRALVALPGSAKKTLQNSFGPSGGNVADLQQQIAENPNENPLNPLVAIPRTLKGIWNTFANPGESFAQDPVGTVQTLGTPLQLLQGGVQGGIKIANELPGAGTLARAAVKSVPYVGKPAVGAFDFIKNLQPEADEWTGFQPSPSIARKIRYPGPADPRAGMPTGNNAPTGWVAPDGSLTPPPLDADIPDPGQFKVNPAIKRKIAGGGPASASNSSGVSTPRGKGNYPGKPAPAGPTLPEAEAEEPETLTAPPKRSGAMSPDEEAAHTDYGNQVRSNKNQKMAEYFAKIPGMTRAKLSAMRDAEYEAHLKANGFRKSTGKGYSRSPEAARQQVIDLLPPDSLEPPPQ